MRMVPGPPPGEERAYKLPIDGEPIVAWIRTPTQAQRRQIYRKLRGLDGEKLEEAARDPANLKEWMREALSLCFVRVEGYYRQTAQGPVAVEKLVELEEYGEEGLLDLIAGEILTAASLSEAEKKTSSESSVSISSEIQASPGTAAPAEPKDSAGQEAATAPPPNHISSSERRAAL